MRMQAMVLLGAMSALPLMAPMAGAQEEDASPFRGRVFAEQLCSSCHAVKSGQVSPDRKAPPFDAAANTKGMTAMALNVWLHTDHPSMPNILLKPEATRDIIAYILTLRDQRN